jgi:hypothetical protein
VCAADNYKPGDGLHYAVCDLGGTTAAGGRSAPNDGDLAAEGQALAALLAQVVELAADRAVFPGRLAQIGEQAMEHDSVRRAVCALDRAWQGDGRG